MKNNSTGRLLDERAAAQTLGCSTALLRKMRLFKTGPAYCKIGRLVRYAPHELQAYIAANRIGGDNNG